MGLSRRRFTREFKVAALQRLETGAARVNDLETHAARVNDLETHAHGI